MNVESVPFARKKTSSSVSTIEAMRVDADLVNAWAASIGITYSVSPDDTSCHAGETGCSWDGKHISDDNQANVLTAQGRLLHQELWP